MGSFNVACSVSRKTITCGDDILVFLGSQAKANAYSLPFVGTYDDCGQIKLSVNKMNFLVFDLLKKKMMKNAFLFNDDNISACFQDIKKYESLKTFKKLTVEQIQIFEDFFAFQTFIETYHSSKIYDLSDEEQKELIQKYIFYIESLLNLSFIKNEYWEKKSNLVESFFLFTNSLIKTSIDFEKVKNNVLDLSTLEQIQQCLNQFLYFLNEMKTEGLIISDAKLGGAKNICAHMVLKSVYNDVIYYDLDDNCEWSYSFSLNFKNIVKHSKVRKNLLNITNEEIIDVIKTIPSVYDFEFLKINSLYPIFDSKFKSLLFMDNFTEEEIIDLILNFASKNYIEDNENFSLGHLAYDKPDVYEKVIHDEDFLKLKSLFLNNTVIKHYCFLYKSYHYGMHIAPITYTGQEPKIYDKFFQHILGKTYYFN